ncbi:MAG: CcoQ/FixQ family Cbb3-type cytochrome c oxidase assembly chaperone [Ideonella sp. MAG2]|nr:MAG: CcoQ/FixQ family Cbb3-type cytochrome c oxidase assembly chaperone [Ideonella sp. MAG2]
MDFDVNAARSVVTVLSFALFVGLMVWVYRGHRKAAFDEAALLPFAGDDVPDETPKSQ